MISLASRTTDVEISTREYRLFTRSLAQVHKFTPAPKTLHLYSFSLPIPQVFDLIYHLPFSWTSHRSTPNMISTRVMNNNPFPLQLCPRKQRVP
jgi:hypothetical protein